MEGKGAFLLKAAGPTKTLKDEDETCDGNTGLSVREKAKLIENRMQTESPDTSSITEPQSKPKQIGKVSMQYRSAVFSQWPPENPLGEESKDGAASVDLQECGLSVKSVQGRFEHLENTGDIKNVNKHTNVSGRATQTSPACAPPSVNVASNFVSSAKADANMNAGTAGKSTNLSVKDLIKRLESERDCETKIQCETAEANVTILLGLVKTVANPIENIPNISDLPKTESNNQVVQPDVEVQDLESLSHDKEEKKDGEESIFINDLSDTVTSSHPLKMKKYSSSSSSSEGAYDPTCEEMNEGLEISWKNETVLENSLRQAITDMLNPPKLTTPYQDEDPLMVEGSPELQSNSSTSIIDAREEVSNPNKKSGIDSPILPGGSAEEQIFIPIDADTDVEAAILHAQLGDGQGRPLTADDDHRAEGEEMGMTSELILTNDVETEDIPVKKITGNESAGEIDQDSPEEEILKKILDDLDSVLLSQLADYGEETMSQTDHLYKKLTDLSKDRENILLRQTIQKTENVPSLAIIPDPSKIVYEKEVEELNKETATRLCTLKTVDEETLRAVIVDHQMKQMDIFAKLTPQLTPEIDVEPLQSKVSAIVEQSSRGHVTSALEPEVRSVDVLSQMAEEEVVPTSGPNDVIWIPTPTGVNGGDTDNTESLRSPLSTSTTTFRMESAHILKEEGKTAADSDADSESDDKTLGETVIERAGVSVGDVCISMPTGSGQLAVTQSEPTMIVRLNDQLGSELLSQDEHKDKKDCSAEAQINGSNSDKPDEISNIHSAENNITASTNYSKQQLQTQLSDEEDSGSIMCGTFIMNSGVKTQTFSKVEVQASSESSCSGSRSCSDDESLLSDGDDDDDMRRLQQRYGEILQWSDPEKLSEPSDDDGSMFDSDEVGEEQQVLEQSLKMTLTSNIKDKLPTMTEQDFSVMMSEYRDVIKQAEKGTLGRANEEDRFETFQTQYDDSDHSEEDEDSEEYLETVKQFTSKHEAPSAEAQINDSGLGDTLCPDFQPEQLGHDMATGMDGTLIHTLPISNKMCDASTSMGEMTLRANLGIDVRPMTSESAICTDNITKSETKESSCQLGSTYEVKVPSVHSMGSQYEDSETGSNSERASDGTGSNVDLLLSLTQEMGTKFREITEDLAASDREMVQQCSLAKTDGDLQKWEEIISDHLEKMEDVRKYRQAEVYRNNQKLKDKLLQKRKDINEEDVSNVIENCATDPAQPVTESHVEPIIPMKMIGIQVEEDMLRLKEDLLTKVSSMKEEHRTQDEILKVLSEYRDGQRELIERRLAEKERASRKLQERLAKKKLLKKEAEERRASPSVTDQIRQMDDTFYSDLCERRRTQPFSEAELGTLIAQHVDKVETFRRRLEEEVRQKRREAIQKRLAEVEESQEEKERDANFANELVMKQRENAHLVKNVRERERARFDEKLQAKLAERKKRRDQRDVDT